MSADIIEHARGFLGTPWVHQGRSRAGVDCLGLAALTARAVRGYTWDITNYAAQATDETMLQLCAEHMDPVPLARLAPGHVVVIRYQRQRHMAIVGDYAAQPGALSLIHASSIHGKVVEHRLDSRWQRIIIAAFALRDLRGTGEAA